MKLDEIIDVSLTPAEFDEKTLSRELKRLSGGTKVLDVSSTLEIRYVSTENTYTLVKGEQVLGWLELERELPTYFGVTYCVLKFVYIVPEYRKTRAAGAFLVALKKVLKHPLLLGDDRSYGGVLFAGGASLVKALNRASRADLSVLNFKTGKKTELPDTIPAMSKFTTIVFENNEFPLIYEPTGTFIFEGAEDRPFAAGKI